jgi:hypothetical protein
MDHNTVFLNASTGGVNLAATGLFSATAPLTTMRNNLIVNQSTAKGTGRAIAFQRSSTITTSYLNRSNGNSFFAGTPGASNLIYADGTNSLQTLAAYRTFIGTNKDSIAVSVNPVFQSTSFGTDSFLRLTVLNTANCQLNKGGVPVNYVTTDYWNAARNNRQPDIGAHEFLPIPVITQQPVSVDICPGANTSFSVSNTAAGSSTYQWFRNGSALTNGGAISGATTASLTVTGATTADTGIYVLRTWLCQGDTAVSANARLRLNTLSLDPTSITASPKDTICIGKTATLQVNGGSLGTGATWRWYSGSCSGTSIGSGTSISVSPAVATTYFARAEGTCNNTKEHLKKFHDGAFKLAIPTKLPIAVFTIIGAGELWPRDTILIKPGKIIVYWSEIIKMDEYTSVENDMEKLKEKVRETMKPYLEKHYPNGY